MEATQRGETLSEIIVNLNKVSEDEENAIVNYFPNLSATEFKFETDNLVKNISAILNY